MIGPVEQTWDWSAVAVGVLAVFQGLSMFILKDLRARIMRLENKAMKAS